jgi:hypothetical protein
MVRIPDRIEPDRSSVSSLTNPSKPSLKPITCISYAEEALFPKPRIAALMPGQSEPAVSKPTFSVMKIPPGEPDAFYKFIIAERGVICF